MIRDTDALAERALTCIALHRRDVLKSHNMAQRKVGRYKTYLNLEEAVARHKNQTHNIRKQVVIIIHFHV